MLRFVSVLFVSVALLGAAVAQTDPSAGDVDLFGDQTATAYVFVQMAQSGLLEESAEGLLTITLQGIGQDISVLQVSPPSSLLYNTDSLVKDWDSALQANPSLRVPAELRLGSDVLYLALKALSYDATSASLVLSAELLDYLPTLEGAAADPAALSDKYVLPSSFGQAQFIISGSEDFWTALQDGALLRLQNLRGDVVECAKAYQRISQLNAMLRQGGNEMSSDEVRSVTSELRFWINWRGANCR